MTITITDPYAVLAFGVGLCCTGLGLYMIACTIGIILAIKDERRAK